MQVEGSVTQVGGALSESIAANCRQTASSLEGDNTDSFFFPPFEINGIGMTSYMIDDYA